jgi:hypothetical protein
VAPQGENQRVYLPCGYQRPQAEQLFLEFLFAIN